MVKRLSNGGEPVVCGSCFVVEIRLLLDNLVVTRLSFSGHSLLLSCNPVGTQ